MITQRRLFFLVPFAPRLDAAHGGGKVIAQLLSHLSTHHRVALVYLRGAGEPPLDESLRRQCALVEEVKRPWTGTSFSERVMRRGRLVASLLFARPLWVTDWASREFSARVQAAVQSFQPEIIHLEFHVMGQYLADLRHSPAPRILTMHETSERASPYLQSQNKAIRLLNALDRMAWKRYEPAIIRDVRTVVVFTENDRAIVEKMSTATPVVTIAPGTEIPEQPPDPAGDAPPNLLFFGSFVHPPNVEAALRLVSEIFPAVQAKIPELELFIVGDQPPPELIQRAGRGVLVTGRVPDVAPYLNRATLVVAPLRLGSGMRVKILESLAHGKAIVASPVAVQGLNLENGKHFLCAENDSDFCNTILQLLSEPTTRALLGSSARAWACGHLTWDRAISKYDTLYHVLLENPG